MLLSRRFDRNGITRIPFLSRDGHDRLKGMANAAATPEIVDSLVETRRHGRKPTQPSFFVASPSASSSPMSTTTCAITGFSGQAKMVGHFLLPMYLNPTPVDLKARVLTTNIDLDEGTRSLQTC